MILAALAAQVALAALGAASTLAQPVRPSPPTAATALRPASASSAVAVTPTMPAVISATAVRPATTSVTTPFITPAATLTVAPPSPSNASSVQPPSAATQGSAPVFSPPGFTPVARAEEAEPTHEPGQLLVMWTSQDDATSGLATLLSRYQQRPRVRYALGSLGFTLVMLALPSEREALALLAQLRAEQPDWIVDRNARSSPMQGTAQSAKSAPESAPESVARLYAHKMLNGLAPASTLALVSAAPVLRLGVIDSSLDTTFAQAAALNGSTLTQRSVLAPADKPAPSTHGNAVLQLIASKAISNGFSGAAPPLALFWAAAMRDVSGKPSTNSLSIVLALDWLASQQVALINMSLGGRGDAVLKAAIERLQSKNILVIAAAGNNPAPDAPVVYPAAYPGVWAITAIDAAGKLYAQAQRASYVSMAAPGVELWIPQPQEVQGANPPAGGYVSGTSYAAALASAALAWQPPAFWAWPQEQRLSHICTHARKLLDAMFTGCGLIQKVTLP